MTKRDLDELKTFGAVVADEQNHDPGFRAEWQRLTLAREVAAHIIRYRAEKGLSQRALAAQLGVSQPRIVALESGEQNPSVDTLIDLSRATGLEFAFDVAPANRKAKLVTKGVRERHSAVVHDDVSVVAAAG
ncbi:MAG TPA: helix-turn-helix transcriptional regulator [Solirubrobacteraceae bacterium]|nr:helix-turn-helix transcriptional regulator [Solirubrobacteraceae bacterium]